MALIAAENSTHCRIIRSSGSSVYGSRESEPDLAAFDKDMQEFMRQSKPKPDAKKPSHIDMYTEGKREIFRVW